MKLNAFVAGIFEQGQVLIPTNSKHAEQISINEKFQSNIETHFLVGFVLAVAVVYA